VIASRSGRVENFAVSIVEILMKTYLVTLLALLTACVVSNAGGQEKRKQLPMVHMAGLLRLVETIPLPTEGYMDHLAVDLKNHHLFLSGENNKSFVVVDMSAGKVLHETKGLGGNPRKPFFDPQTNEIWVDLGDNTVVSIDANTYEVTKTVELTGGKGATKKTPDNAAYDLVRGLYYAAVGTSGTMDGSIDIVDTKNAKLVRSIKMNGSDPAGVVLDPSGKRLYVGMGDVVNGESVCKVVDTDKREVIAEWPITGGPQPHVAALDAAHHRLFMGSRLQGGHQGEPGKLVVMDMDTGKVIQVLDSVGGADEIFYDASTGRIYFSGSTGTIAVFKEQDPDHYELLGKVPTGALGKSGLWIPELKRYYSAVPKHIVQTPPYGANDYITEEAHLMVFDYLP
jgi:DNA-binding beta-propeller fold protein YncE